jgi:hypothetical protein
MKRVFVGALFAFALTLPAQADCLAEIDDVWSAVEASDLTDGEKEQIATILEGARQQQEVGDPAACAATVDQVKLALGMEQ